MRVLIVNYEFPPLGGGGSTVSYYVARSLVRAGIRVAVVTSHFKGLQKTETLDGISIYRVPAQRKRTDFCSAYEMLTFVLNGAAPTLKVAKSFKPDLVQAYFVVPSGPLAYLVKKACGIPYVVYLGGSDVPGADPYRFPLLYKLLRPPVREIWKNAEAVISASQGLKNSAHKIDPALNVEVVANGVDTERFYPDGKENNNGGIKILAVGRLIPRKGFQYLLKALPEVIERANRDFHVEIIGDGPYRENLTKLARELGVAERLNFAGKVSYGELVDIYRNADLFVLPSSFEGMPCVLLEAMACGLPVVATCVPGSEDLVRNDCNGYLVPSQDSRALADGLVKAINCGERLRHMGKESVGIAQDYDWPKIARRYINVYERVLSKRAR